MLQGPQATDHCAPTWPQLFPATWDHPTPAHTPSAFTPQPWWTVPELGRGPPGVSGPGSHPSCSPLTRAERGPPDSFTGSQDTRLLLDGLPYCRCPQEPAVRGSFLPGHRHTSSTPAPRRPRLRMTHFTAKHPLSGGCSASQEPDILGDQLRFILKGADSCYCVKHVLLMGHSSPSGGAAGEAGKGPSRCWGPPWTPAPLLAAVRADGGIPATGNCNRVPQVGA